MRLLGFAIALLALMSAPAFALVIWSTSATDSIAGRPVIFGSRAIYATYDGWVYAVSADSGAMLWTLNTNEKIRLEPQMADGSTLAVATESNVLFINAASGSLLAKVELESPPLSFAAAEGRAFAASNGSLEAIGASGVLWRANLDGLPGAIGYSGGYVMLTAGGKLYCFSASSGAMRWEPVAAEDSFTSVPSEYDGTIYFGATNGKLYAVDAASGRVRWAYQTGGWVAGTPTASSSAVYFGSLDGSLYSLTTGGTFRWKFKAGAAISTKPELYSSQGHLSAVFGSSDGNLYGLDTTDGSEMWSYSAQGKPSSAVRYKDYFIFTTSKGRVYALSPSPICSFVWPKNGDVVGDWPVDFEGRASSDYGLQGVEVRAGRGQWIAAEGKENWHATIDMKGLQSGTVEVECRARDSSGKAESDNFAFITLIKSEDAPPRQMFIVSKQVVAQNESFLVAVRDAHGRELRGVKLKVGANEISGNSPFEVVLGRSGLVAINAEKEGYAPASITVKGTGGADILLPAIFVALLLLGFYLLAWPRLAVLVRKK